MIFLNVCVFGGVHSPKRMNTVCLQSIIRFGLLLCMLGNVFVPELACSTLSYFFIFAAALSIALRARGLKTCSIFPLMGFFVSSTSSAS